jgi:hypothetical protein
VDRRWPRLRGAAGSTDVLVVGVAERTGTTRPTCAVAVAPARPSTAARCGRPSTRRAPYVQLVDVAPTVLALLGEPVPGRHGRRAVAGARARRRRRALADAVERAPTARAVTVPFFVALLARAAGLLAALRRAAALRAVAARRHGRVGASYAAQLVPWWRSPGAAADPARRRGAALSLAPALARSGRAPCGLVAASAASSTCSRGARCRWTRGGLLAARGRPLRRARQRRLGVLGTAACLARRGAPRPPRAGRAVVACSALRRVGRRRRGGATSGACWRSCPPSRCSAAA